MNSDKNNNQGNDQRAMWLLPLLSLVTLSIYYTSVVTRPVEATYLFAIVVLVGYLYFAWDYYRKHEMKYMVTALISLIAIPILIVTINLFR